MVVRDPRSLTTALAQYNDTVTLLVGPSEEKIVVHRSALDKSLFFKAASKKEWGGEQQEMSLPDDDADLLRRYVHYLYSNKLACITPREEIRGYVAPHAAELTLLAKLFVLGEKYQDSTFKNAIIDAIMTKGGCHRISGSKWYMSGPEVDILYRDTCTGSLARALIVDMHISYGNKNWIDETEEQNKDFLADHCRKFYDTRSGTKVEVQGNCFYHEHEDGKRCSGY